MEDSHGFMWFGTVDGLNRYDGYDLITFNIDKDSPNSISNNTIRCLAEDELGRIWIGTDDGLSVYDCKQEKIHQIRLDGFKDGLLTINTALINNEKLYIGTTLGLLVMEVSSADINKIDRSAKIVESANDKGGYHVVACSLGKGGNIWVATKMNLYMLEPNSKAPPFSLRKVLELPDILPNMRGLEEDRFGNLWIISHDDGFIRYNPESKQLKHFKKDPLSPSVYSNKISSVAIDKTDNLWIGTHDKGLLFLENEFLNDADPVFQLIEHDPYNDRSLNSNLIYSLFVSKNNLLWIGTIGSGVNVYNPYRKPFRYYNLHSASIESSYSTNFIRAVYADVEDNLWIGTHNNGLFIYEMGNSDKIDKVGFGNEPVFHLNDAGGGNTLVCSGQGVSLVRRVNKSIEVLSTLPIGPTFYTTRSTDGVFWAASLNGIVQCRLKGGEIVLEQAYNTGTEPALSFNNARVLSYSPETKQLFVGTEGGGLNVLQLDANRVPVSTTVYMKNDSVNSISNNYIRSVIKGSNSDVWIGTYEGLNKMSTDPATGQVTFKVYTRKNGLPNNTVQSIVEDNNKDLWMGTNQGLSKFDPTTEIFSQYTLNDGIQSNEFSEHTIFKKANNEIIVGGINGINTFFPDQIVPGDFQPQTTLTNFYLFNKKVIVGEQNEAYGNVPLKQSISLTDSIFLEPAQNSFGFDFSAMVYNSPEKVQYAYMLEGFDEDWTITGAKNRKANYTNLGYGDYIFRVKASNNNGLWEEEAQRLFISVKTPIYYTTWAFLLYGLLGIMAVFFLANYSILRHTTKNKILLENQHNKKIRELEELRTQFFINVSHDLRTPLTLISSPLEVIRENKSVPAEMKSLLDLVARNVKKLRDMTEQLLDIRKVETDNLVPKLKNQDLASFLKNEVLFFENAFKAKGVGLEVVSEKAYGDLSFDPDMMSKVIFNILSNALKHTHEGKVIISICESAEPSAETPEEESGNEFIKISIKDSGDGIDKADLPMVFDRFYQGSEQNKKGYGIGLSHSKDLIDAHNGHVNATSEKGVGATFNIYLPNVQLPLGNQVDVFPVTEEEAAVAQAVATAEKTISTANVGASEKKSILLVEDNIDLREFIAGELRKKYKVLEAEDGKEGLEMAKEHFPDLIVSDVMMPNMDGMEFCKEIKSNIKSSHIPVILLTAKIGKEAKYAGLEIGADEYISKPFEMKYLSLKIRNLLKGRERLREMFRSNATLEPSKVTVTSIDESFLTRLMTEIEKGIPEFDFSIKDLEQKMGMSHASFYNKIKILTGQSAKELVFNLRMKRAKQIIEDTSNIRISEVAYMVGFSDPKYFSKRFKEKFGAAPSDFAKK